MSEKQVLAALEITDHEIRLLVGEYYNTRVNVLRTEIVPNTGMDGLAIKNRTIVVNAIKEAINNASKALKVKIEKVLLLIPSYRFSKESIRLSKEIDNYNQTVTIEDIQTLIRKGYTHPVGEDQVLINWVPVKYYTNRIAFKKPPIDENCNILEIEMDLLSADKLIAYDYTSAIEQAGIGVVDICLDCYACAKETSLFEKSVENPTILIMVEGQATTLGFIKGGKLEACKLLNEGYSLWEKIVSQRYNVSTSIVDKLIFQNVNLAVQSNDNSPIYLWKKDDNKTLQISEKELQDTIKPALKHWAQEIKDSAIDLMKIKGVNILLCGKGAELDGLDSYLSRCLEIEAKTYYPDTIGAKESYWSGLLGAIYAFVDIYPLYRNKEMSVNQAAFLKINNRNSKAEEPEDSVSKKLHGFFQYK